MDEEGNYSTINMSRAAHVASNVSERNLKIAAAHKYFGRFDNVRSDPGLLKNGIVRELLCETSICELG